MDQADEELRGTITHIWPFQAKKMLDLLVPRTEHLNRSNLTVGKIYAGLLILESWRNTRFGQLESGVPVNIHVSTAPIYVFIFNFVFVMSNVVGDISNFWFRIFLMFSLKGSLMIK